MHNTGSLGLDLEGQNMTAYVWDLGVPLTTHQEYDGPGGTDRVTKGNSVPPFFHPTEIMGTILASGVDPLAKGMAPQANGVAYDWDYDIAEATNEASNGMLISNHSYHEDPELIADWEFGAYTNRSRDWDIVMNNASYYLTVAGAGNDGDNTSFNGLPLDGNSGYDKLTGDISTPKNGLIIANADDADVAPDGTLIDVEIDFTSSQGPTDDYRIKPEIAGNGTDLFSPSTGSNNSTYYVASGTSMASPNVAGSLLLLQQHYNQTNGNFMKAATLKGLALHTADDTETNGPDAVWGWGLLNAKRAVETISNNGTESLIIESTLEEGETYTLTVYSDNTNPLLASICWNDPAGIPNTGIANDPTPVLVNDLDLRVSNATEYFPWKLTSVTTNAQEDNIVDPFERVDVIAANGSYTITVSHKDVLTNDSQDFSLVVTGITGSTVGIANLESDSFNLWPNPSNGTVNISFDLANTQDVKVELYNIVGELLSSRSYRNETGSFNKTINFGNLTQGMYFVKINSGNTKSIEKIIIK